MLKFKARAFYIVFASIFAVMLFIECDSNPTNSYDDNFTYTGRTVEIGDLTWMAENLNRNTSDSWCYDNNPSNCALYGRLYAWNAAMTACPSDWRLPTDADWDNLVETAGGSNVAGEKLKSKTGWNNDGNGTDEFGFSALPGGGIWGSSLVAVGIGGGWWSATEVGTGTARNRVMEWNVSYVGWFWNGKGVGHSVRCVRD